MNTSSGFAAAVGAKKMRAKKSKGSKSGGTKLPSGLKERMANAKHDQQPVPENALSSYGRRRKAKMRGT